MRVLDVNVDQNIFVNVYGKMIDFAVDKVVSGWFIEVNMTLGR